MAHTVDVSGGEVMLTNASCTVYRKNANGGYDREFVPTCFWMDSRGASVKTGGVVGETGVTVYFPSRSAPTLTAQSDILVRGDCPHVFDNTSASSISSSLRVLAAAYDIVTVASVEDKRYGATIPHIKVVAK